jgi:hypothetical protein
MKHNRTGRSRWLLAGLALVGLSQVPAMASPCRVTDFTDKPLSALSEVQRLAVVTEMTRTEYMRFKAAAPGSPNYYKLVADSANITTAREAAHAKFATLKLDNVDDYRQVWASDFLTDDQLRKYTNCITQRQPGLVAAGRFETPTTFHLTYSHITPIGIEKIRTVLVASYNVANAKELEASLEALGPQDNYAARTFPLVLEDPGKRAVLVLRAGWETPRFVFIPTPAQSASFK